MSFEKVMRGISRACAVLIIAGVCLALLPAGVDSATKKAPYGGAGEISDVDGIAVVSLSGPPRGIGYVHGKLLGGRLAETEEAFKKLMPPIPGGFLGRWLVRMYVMFKLGDIERHLTADELEEMKGMAESGPDKDKDYRDLLYYHVLQDIGQNYACTGGAACGKASALTGPVAGRNFDMNKDGVLDPLKTVFVYRPDDGQSYVSLAWPGMVGVVSGMNEHGLCVMVFSDRSDKTSMSGVPVAFLARRVLAGATDVESAVDIIKGTPRMGANTFLLVDCSRAAAIEFDAEKLAVREISEGTLAVSNHFLSAAFKDDDKNKAQSKFTDSAQRLERMALLLSTEKPVSVRGMVKALRDHSGPCGNEMSWGDPAAINNTKDAHSVVFDPVGRRLWVATPPSAYGSFIGFRLTKAGLTRSYDLPPSGYIDTPEAIGAMDSEVYLRHSMYFSDEGLDDEAAAYALDAMGLDPDNYQAAIRYGRLCMDSYSYREALDAFDSAVMHAPDCYPSMSMALAGRGEAERKLGMRDKARSDFEAVLEMDCCREANEMADRGLSYL
jgi:tetratricopeptide (TPR) repeat protein